MKNFMAIAVSMRGVPCVIESEESYENLGYIASVLTSKLKMKKAIKERFYDDTEELAIPISIGDYIIKKQKIGSKYSIKTFIVTDINLRKEFVEMKRINNNDIGLVTVSKN